MDSFVFPGNSGSPAILRPEIVSIEGTSANNAAYLMGIVEGYLAYSDIAISMQTHHQRITFEENSGLAEIIPMDRVNEAIKASGTLP